MSDDTPKNPSEALAALRCGKILNENVEDYHAAPALSTSKLKVFRQSPALYYGRFISHKIPPPEPTDALIFGSAADCYILEGEDAFLAKYYIIPRGVGKQRVEDKKIRAALADANPGKIDIKQEWVDDILRMNENIQAHPFAGPMLRACTPQITWRMKGDLFHVQARTDGWAEEGCEYTDGYPFIGDLKTIAALPDDEPETISKQISSYWYHGQEGIYRRLVSEIENFKDGLMPRFFFWFVEKEEPFRVHVVELDEVAQDLASIQIRDTIDRLKICHTENRWPNSWDDTWRKTVPAIALPRYYVRRELEERSAIF